MSVIELGGSIPALTPHASSVSLPTWADNVAYEEAQPRVMNKMTTGYPRFFIHKAIVAFAEDVVKKYGNTDLSAMLFPSCRTAQGCVDFILVREPSIPPHHLQIVDLVLDKRRPISETLAKVFPSVSAVLFRKYLFPIAKQYWQHSGAGISSRRAEFCHGLFQEGVLIDERTSQPSKNGTNGFPKPCKGPRRYQRASTDKIPLIPKPDRASSEEAQQKPSTNESPDTRESSQFLEERFGRNLDVSLVENAKLAIRRRISGTLMGEVDLSVAPSLQITSSARGSLSHDDVYLYPCGMNSIFNAHKMMLKARGQLKSISFGFPYIDTLKILEKFGPGCLFYGNGSSADLDDLEARLERGERYLALFCEFPGNPMLKCPDLKRIRALADTYGFGMVVDETIGNFINVNVFPYADVVVSSLTKIFSGECNVMGEVQYEDNYWAEDAIFMERNSRHFVSRIERINDNAEVICDILRIHPLVKAVYYPKYNQSREFYDACRTPTGGYGGLLSFEFQTKAQAIAFFDRIETAKGPSLGTNFTLTSPYVILAHFLELEWAAQFGVPADLIRISVGLEDADDLKSRFAEALLAAEKIGVLNSSGQGFIYMAPQKRSRREDDDEIIAVESASSSLRHESHRKKVRLSVNQFQASKSRSARGPTPTDSSSDEDEDLLNVAEEYTSAPPASTQYEILRDGDFKHLQNPDHDDRIATQRLVARKQLMGENREADNAIIQEITCYNFMCHERLSVKLGPLINFVVGHNGSGKSAVLTAITLCLGGKAASTNRGASLKSLIKTGTDSAILVIKLKNEGNDAYQPDVYGESIIIERHFSRSGGSSYKLKSAMGRVISSKKADVDDIIEYYQLQVDNPMNVLTQDAAKSFITSSTPSQKYKFFVEGVQLEALDNDYKVVSELCDNIERKLEDTKGDIEDLKKNADAAIEKRRIVQEHEGMRLAAKNLQRQSAWSQVVAAQQKIGDQQKEVALISEALQKTDNMLERARTTARQIEEELVPLKEEEKKAKAVHKEASDEVQKVHSQQREIRNNLVAAKKKVTDFKADIEAEVQRMEDANGGAQARKATELHEAEQATRDTKDALKRNEEEGPTLEGQRRAAAEELKKTETSVTQKRQEVEQIRNRLKSLTQNREDIMAGYDTRLPQLLKMIRDQQSQFKEKPVGPIGFHITVLKPSWSNTIETVLGNALNSFVVTCKSDQTVLSRMIKHLNMQSTTPVIIGNRHPINTNGNEPDPQYETILRVLDIDDDLVRNQLIINQSIEQSILVPKRTDALRIMYDQPSKPRNVRQCFSHHDSRRDYGHRFAWTGRNKNLEDMTGVKYQFRKSRMKSDAETQIHYQKDIFAQAERDRVKAENESAQARAKLQKLQTGITQHKRECDKLKIAVQRAEEKCEALQAELDRDTVEDGRFEALKGLLEEAERALEIDQTSYGNLTEAKEALADCEAKLRKAQERFRRIEQARKLELINKNAAFEKVNDLEGAKAHAIRKKDQQAAQVESFTAQASQVSARVPINEGETSASLDAKIKKMQSQIKAYNRRVGGTDQEVYEAAIEAMEKHNNAKTSRKEIEGILEALKHSFMKRIVMFRRFQQHISARSRINFNYLLSERAFRGKLTIDHINKKLDVHVEPDEMTKSGKGRQTKTLSGGEKSFSSICLLLSLWEAMGAPLRCLDEFDVFMDDVNRDVSTKMIISAARRSVGRQFILITPKALVPELQVRKILFDPREKQRRIDEMVQDDD
ncbi:hypothetical protein G7Y89_g1946 [Cudoniella acicularis]|uniref:RecF/RecN/SMC N-terminal domain-containing protein n=1 Tax=Cudoniella acicularis TaxID=354080 RepID=A0A8H4RV38_9HELO|nr:hypothetical protein G7Y89_g1946 [Cudoniella acicularis]